MSKPIFLLLLALTALHSCNEPATSDQGICNVEIELSNAYNQWIYLDRLSIFEEGEARLDSIYIKDRVQKVQFTIKDSEERLYKIYSKDHRIDIILINTREPVKLTADYFDNGKFDFISSRANTSLHDFLRVIRRKAEQLRQLGNDSTAIEKFNSGLVELQSDYRNYVDTVGSPAAALYVYNAVDFGRDRDSLKLFVNKLQKRFPAHKGIGMLVLDVNNFLSIYEQELEIGDTIPVLTVFDSNGLPATVKPESNFTLIEFWASWDQPSRVQMEIDKKALGLYKAKGFSIVSISLDPEKKEWERFLQSGKYPWKQLFDGRAWKGASVQAYKFDSIPFNYLVDKNGKILDKALFGERLLKRLDSIR